MKYERLTGQEWSDNIDLTQELGYSYIYKRLYEIEDKIERGELVENNVITLVNMARSGSKTLIAKALAYDELKAKIERGKMIFKENEDENSRKE